MLKSEVPVLRSRRFGSIARTLTFPDVSLIEVRYAAASVLPTHAHESSMYLLTLEGSFEERVGRRTRRCGPRRLVYRPAAEEHSQLFGPSGTICFAIELAAENDPMRESTRDRLELDGTPTFLAMRLYDEFSRPTTDTPLVVEETVTALLARAHDVSRERTRPHWLSRVVDVIEARTSTTIRLRDLAREVDRHPIHVSRCFRRYFGCDVAEFVRRRRVHDACRLIREGRETLSAIAAASGFSDQSHMGRAFRQVMGRSPGTYR